MSLHPGREACTGPEQPPAALGGARGRSRAMLTLRKRQNRSGAGVECRLCAPVRAVCMAGWGFLLVCFAVSPALGCLPLSWDPSN